MIIKLEDIVGFDFVKSYGGIVDVIDYVEEDKWHYKRKIKLILCSAKN